MTTHVCPACGYPTLKPALCAFCCPGEVFSGAGVFGTSSFAKVAPFETNVVADSQLWSGAVAS